MQVGRDRITGREVHRQRIGIAGTVNRKPGDIAGNLTEQQRRVHRHLNATGIQLNQEIIGCAIAGIALGIKDKRDAHCRDLSLDIDKVNVNDATLRKLPGTGTREQERSGSVIQNLIGTASGTIHCQSGLRNTTDRYVWPVSPAHDARTYEVRHPVQEDGSSACGRSHRQVVRVSSAGHRHRVIICRVTVEAEGLDIQQIDRGRTEPADIQVAR